MVKIRTILASVAFAATAGAVAAPASADDRGAYSARPAYCPEDHDHRSHDANYYDYYPADRYSRAGPYVGVEVGVRYGDGRYGDGRYGDGRYGDGRYGDGRYGGGRYGDGRYGDGRGGAWGRDRLLQRRDFATPYRARIVLVERVEWTRRGEYLTCNVFAVGPEADYVRNRELRRVARNFCSYGADIRIADNGDGYGYRYGEGWR